MARRRRERPGDRALVDHAAALRGAITTEVNEEIDQAVGLYAHIGFGAIGRSERDGQGRPWPLIPLRFDPQS